MDKAFIEEHFIEIANYFLTISKEGYSKPFQMLYERSQQQLQSAIKFYQEMQKGGKYLNKLPKRMSLEEGKVFAAKRLKQLIYDICYFLTSEARADLKKRIISCSTYKSFGLTADLQS